MADTAYSVLIDDDMKAQYNTYDKLQPRKLKTWVQDETVSECYLCLKPFGLFLRKHHCRNCGHIFCYNCSRFMAVIPEALSYLPRHLNNTDYFRENLIDWYKWMSNKKNSRKQRVCEVCHEKLKQLDNMRALINIFENIDLDIFEFKKIGMVCKLWHQLSNYYLSQFREIQYYLPNHTFNQLDRRLLWSNRQYIIGHSKYLIQLLNSIEYDKYEATTTKLREITTLLKEDTRKSNCKQMLCTRNCQHHIASDDALTLLHPRIKSKYIRKYAMYFISKVSLNKISAYVPYLINKMAHESSDNSVIGNFLVGLCRSSVDLANLVYWQLKVSSEYEPREHIYKFFIEKMEKELPTPMIEKIHNISNFKSVLDKTKNAPIPIDFLLNKVQADIVVPTHPSLLSQTIDKTGFRIIDSATRPMVLPLCLKNVPHKYHILYKTDDVRKDLIIMSLIRLMDQILKDDEKLDLNIITYNILPVSSTTGFVEMIPNCETVYKIREKMSYSLLNYIIDKNPSENVDNLRYRFMKSCAAYCVITYLLGIGDRHLSNIMITNDGYLFHIDFGFVLGYDPKPIKEVSMRIFPDMVDALGGVNSQYYNEFKKLCTKIFNTLRKHINLFVNMLTLFSEIKPPMMTNSLYSPEFSDKMIIQEILRRFIPGQNCNQAELTFYNCINSSTKTYQHTVTDFFHYHQQENTIQSLIYNTYSTTKGFMSEIYRYVNNNSPNHTRL